MKQKIIALLTDFGLSDHFVGTMKGVILNVDPKIRIYDISHHIQPQNILEAAYTLIDTLPYWPKGTIFVTVVDPGVGTDRRSIVVKSGSGHYIICPDNGLITLVEQKFGLEEIREISEEINRLPGSESSYTFHGRDIYAYNAARLASRKTTFEKMGDIAEKSIEKLSLHQAFFIEGNISGNIVKIEKPFGNLCTNIPMNLLSNAGLNYGDTIHYVISESGTKRLEGELPLVKTFGDVNIYNALTYIDSSGRLGFSINQGDFSDYFQIGAGQAWEVQIKKPV